MIRQTSRFLCLALALTAGVANAQDAAGVISGRVTDAQTAQPVSGVQVRVANTNLGAVTTENGAYAVRGVPAGIVQLRVSRIGFAEQTRPVTVTAGATTTQDFGLARVSIQLAEVVTTATGEQRRVEIANAITTIDASDAVATGGVSNIGDVLATRSPSVNILQSGMVGAGARVRIRGTSSLALSNEPIYIVDGVRIETGAASLSPNIGVGGTVPSRANDLNPDEIESIDVVRGPSAATLYGTDAANGVIVITTKRGRVGAPRVSTYMEQGLIQDNNKYPTNFSTYGDDAFGECYLIDQADGACTQDSISRFNPMMDKTATPLQTGYRQEYGAQVAGGNAAVRYFISGEYEGQDGVYRIPGWDKQRLTNSGIKIRDEWTTPNMANRSSGRVNLDVAVSPKMDLGVRAGFTQELIRLPQNDNNITGLYGNTLLSSGRGDLTDADGLSMHGYTNFTPGDIFQETVEQNINRFIGSLNPQWRPMSWLTIVGDAGLDYTGRTDSDLCRFSECTDFGTNRLGFKENDRTSILQYTTNARSTANFQVMPALQSRTSIGVQYTGTNTSRNGSGASNLPVGTSTTTAGSVPFADEASTLSRTIGAYAEEQVSWRERLFVTVGARADRSSAFGVDFGNVVYPKASASYVISDEDFFPKASWLNQLRLRAAIGSSGVRPGVNDATPYFASTAVTIAAADVPGVVISTLGNRDLKPEKSTELEAGLDGSFLNSRFTFEFTYYDKNSKDALINQVLAPSLGTLATGRLANLGKINNHGVELSLTGKPISANVFGWDVALNGSYNSNSIVTLGQGIPPIIGTTITQRQGFPLNSYFGRSFTYSDANHDGLIGSDEVTVSSTASFQGYSLPRREFALVNGFDFLNQMFRVQAVLDHKGGHKLLNGTDRIRCQSFFNCRDLADPSSTLEHQARAVALVTTGTQVGYMEKADFTRLREVSLTFNAPARWASMARTSALSATLSGRNLAVWTDYTGIDPESSYGQGDVPNDFLTQAPLSFYTFRINVGF